MLGPVAPAASAALLLVVVSGCLGLPGTGPAVDPLADSAAILHAVDFSTEGDADVRVGEVPAGYGAQLARFEARPDPAATAAELRMVAPNGTEFRLYAGTAGSGANLPDVVTGWAVLPAATGAWTLRIVTDAPLAGHLNTTVQPAVQLRPIEGTGADRVVVAIVDSGINPYHEVFRQAPLATADLPTRVRDAATASAPLSLPSRLGEDWISSLANDVSGWAAIPPNTLVHVEGTNVLGYHLEETELPSLPVLDNGGHGTAVAHSVVRENPDVLVVLVTGGDYDDGVFWAASQPWIDFISLSWGPAVNAAGVSAWPPVSSAADAATGALPFGGAGGGFVTPEATLAAWRAGKVTFTASGNDPTPTFTDTTSGPPWAHAVAGSLPGGRAPMSGNFVDTVADWTQTLASHRSLDETRTMSGTSFATPTTAGIASRILHEVRTATGHEGGIVEGALVRTDTFTLTNGQLRDVLNRSAAYWDTQAPQPEATDPLGAPVPVAPAPWVSQGWGHLDGSAVERAVGHILGTSPLPEKPAEAQAWMDAMLTLRAQWWSPVG